MGFRHPGPQRKNRAVTRFAGDERGTFAVFSLFVFVTMLLIASLAVDMMRHETVRTRMQGLTDRAVLAATMLGANNGVATPEQLLESYFTAGGMRDQLGSNYSVTQSVFTGRNVTASPGGIMPSLMSQLVGIEDLPVATTATAAEAVTSAWLDLVMVIDISGSMGFDNNSRMNALRAAAAQLAAQLLSENDDLKVSLTIVPYDTHVLPPATMMPFFNNIHGTVGNCPEFRNYNNITNSTNTPMDLRACHTAAWGQVRPFIGDETQAVNIINGLQPRDVTSIDLGLRWGSVFFDPAMRPAISAMIANGEIDSEYEGRPFDWSEPNVVRAVVLLTDGENCCGHRATQWQQDQNTLQTCNALKNRGVLIYAIAFEAPPAGQSLMMNCASSPSHYFDPQVGGLLNVFAAIASNVITQTLRLVH